MFAMELGKYQDIAQDIVMYAVKELAIERGVKELAEVWKSMEFNVVKHFKGIHHKHGLNYYMTNYYIIWTNKCACR